MNKEKIETKPAEKQEPQIDRTGVVMTPAEVEEGRKQKKDNPDWFREQQ